MAFLALDSTFPLKVLTSSCCIISSVLLSFGSSPTLQCLHSNEYRAKIPPSPLSSALSTMKVYLSKETIVRVQKRKEKYSYAVSFDLKFVVWIVPKTYNGAVLKRPYTTPRVWNDRMSECLQVSFCKNERVKRVMQTRFWICQNLKTEQQVVTFGLRGWKRFTWQRN